MRRTIAPSIPTPSDCIRLSVVWEVISRRLKRTDDRGAAKEISVWLNVAAAKLAMAKEADDRDAEVAKILRESRGGSVGRS